MHLLLIYFPVIMILRFVSCSGVVDIKDLSDWCSGGRRIYYYLTSGAGVTDTSVAMIATEKKLNCTLEFYVKSGNNIVIVIEFPDSKPLKQVCCGHENTSILVRDKTVNDTSQFMGTRRWYQKVARGDAAVLLKSSGDMDTVKIIATSVRDGKKIKCSPNTETECIVNEEVFCMTRQVLCDGHNNCGVAGSYDEDERKCQGPTLTFPVIITSIAMGTLSFVLILSIAVTLIPRRKETYIHNFDPSRSLFDSENGITRAEISILILFPEGTHMRSL